MKPYRTYCRVAFPPAVAASIRIAYGQGGDTRGAYDIQNETDAAERQGREEECR
jgi:hypothetical protein